MEKKTPCPRSITTPFTPRHFENQAWENGLVVCGIDEAGRGCLAGPVVAAAALLEPGSSHPLLRDSKTLSVRQRAIMMTWLTQHARWGVGIAPASFINQYGIVAATHDAMRRAFLNLQAAHPQAIAYVLVDAVPLHLTPHYNEPSCQVSLEKPFKLTLCEQTQILAFNHGELHSPSIAAASVVAKSTRDRILVHLDGSFPAYGLAQHKGYGTEQHYDALRAHGASPLHRTHFLRSLI